MSTSIAKPDCGCGGHDSTPSGGCGCGGNGGCGCGGATCAEPSFKRPRFFAGQLLTEDDLEALTDYVVGKNRLHNRFLFGDGVVCGLTVTCHPCGEGKVTVAPGFALDCCGNDILVPCKQDLDVKALIRSLRTRQLAGYDCGDPCDEKHPGDRTYGLFLAYAETLEDPVVPYASGDPCGQQACEPTRICEGYRFELRCDCALPARPDVFKRILACIGDLRQATAAISKAQTAAVQAAQFELAARALRAEEQPPFDADSVHVLREATSDLADLNEIPLEADLGAEAAPKLRPDERDLRLHVARLQLLTGAITRFRALSEQDQGAALKENEDLETLLDEAAETAAEAGRRIEAFAPKTLTTPLARSQAEESVRLMRKYVLDAQARYDTREARLVALNTFVSFRQVGRVRADAAQIKEWLLDKLDGSPSLTRCDLADRLRRIRVDAAPAPGEEPESAELGSTGRAVRELVQILFEYLVDCICLALNPPCQPCEDQGVLIACLKVRECEVIDICNLSRRFVLSPPALRYWLPPIGAVGELVKRLCCDVDIGRVFNRPPYDPAEPPRDAAEGLIKMKVEDMAIVRSHAPSVSAAEVDDDVAAVLAQFRIAPRDVEEATFLASNLALLSVHAAGVDPGALALRGRAIGEALGGGPVVVEAVEARLREQVAESVGDKLAAALGGVERKLTTRVEGSVEKRVAANVKLAVARELTDARLRRAVQDADAVKALRDENQKLARELKQLSDAVAAMQREGRP